MPADATRKDEENEEVPEPRTDSTPPLPLPTHPKSSFEPTQPTDRKAGK